MKYKLLATDIDGTLVDNNRRLTDETKKALFKAMDAGLILVLASGRPDCGIWPLARELELDKRGGFISAFNGAKIIDCKSGEVIISSPLDSKYLKIIYEAARSHGCALLTHEGNLSITENPEDIYVIREAVTNKIEVKGIERFEDYIDFPVYKFIATSSPETMPSVEGPITEALSKYFDAFRSNAFYLEIVAPGVNKGDSLKSLAKHLSIPIEETIACGDAENDISMIQAAGLGVAMGNAEAAVKQAADYIADTNENDGIAKLISNLL